MGFTSNIENFKEWVVKHKTLALSLPIVVVLSGFFIIENIKDYQSHAQGQPETNGFNDALPSQSQAKSSTLEEEALWKPTSKNQNPTIHKSGPSPELMERTKKEDSIKKVLEALENISFDLDQKSPASGYNRTNQPNVSIEKKAFQGTESDESIEEKLNYRELLREGKAKMLQNNVPIPPSLITPQTTDTDETIKVRVNVYRDQFILPEDRVQLIVAEDFRYQGKLFPRNTFFYASASVKGNRVLLKADNINHIHVNAMLKDYRDGMEGIYSERAGELWGEYMLETQNRALVEMTDQFPNTMDATISPLVRGLGSFLKRKRLKERDRILLINDHELLMIIE